MLTYYFEKHKNIYIRVICKVLQIKDETVHLRFKTKDQMSGEY
jgi:septum formation topological specificity factor MinE